MLVLTYIGFTWVQVLADHGKKVLLTWKFDGPDVLNKLFLGIHSHIHYMFFIIQESISSQSLGFTIALDVTIFFIDSYINFNFF